jgi:hypothetical protein
MTYDERQCWRVHFNRLPGIQTPHAQVEPALSKLNLHDTIIQVQDFNTGIRVEPNSGTADLKLRAGSAVGPEPISANQWTIAHRAEPFALTRRRVTHTALNVIQVGNPLRRVGIGGARD